MTYPRTYVMAEVSNQVVVNSNRQLYKIITRELYIIAGNYS